MHFIQTLWKEVMFPKMGHFLRSLHSHDFMECLSVDSVALLFQSNALQRITTYSMEATHFFKS